MKAIIWTRDGINYARDRDSVESPDQQHDTFNHMDHPTGGPAKWEITVPDGQYEVHIVAGDPDYWDSVYKITAEGVVVVDGTPTSSEQWIEGTATVIVTDGRLTIDNTAGSDNNKIAYIEISQVSVAIGTQSALKPVAIRRSTRLNLHLRYSPQLHRPALR